MGWVSPTGAEDLQAAYGFDHRAYDDNEGTYANSGSCRGDDYLGLTHAALNCDKVRIMVQEFTGEETLVDPNINLDVYYGGAWHNIFSGSVTKSVWVEKAIGSTESVTKMQLALVSCDTDHYFQILEADFNETVAAPAKNLMLGCNF